MELAAIDRADEPRNNFVEPFFLRCETCRARLRVRDERFLGQIQACPKCGSMVHILAPAGWLSAAEATPEPAPAEVAAEAATPSLAARLVSIVRQHAVIASTGAAAIAVAGGLAAVLALRGGGTEVAALPPVAPIAAEVEPESEPQSVPRVETPPSEQVVDAAPSPAQPTPETVPVVATRQEVALKVAAEVQPPAEESAQNKPIDSKSEAPPRALVLEPVEEQPEARANDTDWAHGAMPEYPPTIETAADAPLETPSVTKTPERRTNIRDQLSVPIDAIDLPTMPIGEFVNLMSTMTAVPIRLEAKVLGEVGLSTRSTVTVRGENTTAGKLLAGVLKEHQLTCVERDGTLVIVRAAR